jgi:LPXTG-motif cell wall-anchored protein
MNSTQSRTLVCKKMLVTSVALLAFAFTASAQVESTTKAAPVGAPTKSVQVERGTVVSVNGNNLIVKAEDGSMRDFNNVPESATVTVDGKQLNVHQLKPGMTIERQTVTISTPRLVTNVKTVTGTIWRVTPPSTVVLTLADGKSQMFQIPKGQKFNINGQMVDAFGLRVGMQINAQQVTESPEIEVSKMVSRTGTMPPPPPPAPAPDVPVLVVFIPVPQPPAAAPAPTPAPVEAAPTKLPKTGSSLPLLGLIGLSAIGIGLALKALRSAPLRS